MERRPLVFLYEPVLNDPNYILGAGAEAASLVTAGKSLVASDPPGDRFGGVAWHLAHCQRIQAVSDPLGRVRGGGTVRRTLNTA
jgi:hypothetical protein